MLASEILVPEDFYRSSHQKIFQSMLRLSEKGEPVDLVTVTKDLADAKILEEVGGVSYLSDLAGSVPTAANIEYYAKIVEEKSILRRLIRTATAIAQEGYNREDDVETLLTEAEKASWKWRSGEKPDCFKTLKIFLFEHTIKLKCSTIAKGK